MECSVYILTAKGPFPSLNNEHLLYPQPQVRVAKDIMLRYFVSTLRTKSLAVVMEL